MDQHVDEIVGRIDGHGELLAKRDKRFVVEKHAVVVDTLGRDQREIDVMAIGERAPLAVAVASER